MPRYANREYMSQDHKKMKAELLRRLINLETREQARLPLKSPFPAWLIADWQKQQVPVNDQGVFDWSRMKASIVQCEVL